MKKKSFIAVTILLSLAGIAQTIPGKKDDKKEAKTENRAKSKTEKKAEKKESKNVTSKTKTDAQTK
jgi:hypothetical protein